MNLIRALKISQIQDSEYTLTDTQLVIIKFICSLNVVNDGEKDKFLDNNGGLFFIFRKSEYLYGYKIYKMFHESHNMELREIQRDISFIINVYLGLNSIKVDSTNLQKLSIYK